MYVNHNALVDETLFQIETTTPKRYDAIYNAVLAPFKRHALASKVRNLAVITYFKEGSDDYLKQLLPQLDHPSWLNFGESTPERSTYQLILQQDLTTYLNQARSGLCLSKHEGAMFASIEYMLCGLPVVSTQSFGGRDAFFDDEYVTIVDDTPEAVSEGVRTAIARRVDPEYIRQQTIHKMEEHRIRLLDLVQTIIRSIGKT